MSEHRTWKGSLAAFAVGVVLTGLIAEGILRLAMPEWPDFYSGRFMQQIAVPNFGLVTTGRPGFDGYFAQNNGDFRVRITINDFGLRNPDPVRSADGHSTAPLLVMKRSGNSAGALNKARSTRP